ncbi:CIH_HP2_G0034780.mRNA.1.CDS.1 [Saccharomyces cerevisiae]|nr:CIH_HP2_G0034780.mRNA.1.CDS.1 [Saccharomyces cerevisiae]CAI6635629.1 CIH_HP2_G0034780.mRNA.1.CDS.1 [Saccharomyces cerevisiae]
MQNFWKFSSTDDIDGKRMFFSLDCEMRARTENDLNVMRLFYNKVIDTAILYSKTKFKVSLKNLAFEVLSRKIQNVASMIVL